MSESPLNWQTFSIDEWVTYLEEHKNKNMPELKIELNSNKTNKANVLELILNKNSKPNTVVDWLKLICFVESKHNILTRSNKRNKRLKIFLLNDTIQLPVECLGVNAQRFISTAKQHYQHRAWAPPIRLETIHRLYTLFDQLDADILGDPDWHEFWLQQKQFVVEAIKQVSKKESEKYFSVVQKEILTAYRSFVIHYTEYLEINPDEDDAEHHIDESRIKEFFEQINQHKLCDDERKCYTILTERYTETLEKHVAKATKLVKAKLIEGGSIVKAIHFLEKETIGAVSLAAYTFLPLEKSERIILPLVELKKDYEGIIELIDKHLDSIANQFVPSFDQNSGTRVLNLILQAREAITHSPVFNKRPEVGTATLKKYLGSAEAVTRTYQLALAARIKFFGRYLPNDVDKLVNDPMSGITWIRYPRARREVLAQLFDEVLTNTYKYPKCPLIRRLLGVKISPEQVDALTKIQEIYFDAYQEDMKACSKTDGQNLLLYAQEDKILSPIPKSQFTRKEKGSEKQWIELLEKELNSLPAEVKEPYKPDVYEQNVPPEHDVTYGLFYELSQILNRDENISYLKRSEKNITKTVDISNTVQVVEVPVDELIFNKFQHKILNTRLGQIQDPDERLSTINALFQKIICPDNLHRHSKGLGRLLQHKYNATQKSAIVVLQDNYMQALEAAWVQRVLSYAPPRSIHRLPDSLDITQKNQVYMEYMRTAQKSKVLNCEVSLGRVDQLHYQIQRMVMVLNNIPEKDMLIMNA